MWGPVTGTNAFIILKLYQGHCISLRSDNEFMMISSPYQAAVRLQLASTWSSVRPSFFSRPSLTHYQTSHARWCCRQYNVPQGTCRLFHICHMCTVWTCTHLWTEHRSNDGPANSVVLWQMAIELHGAKMCAEVPLEDVKPPSCQLYEVCFWLFGQKLARRWGSFCKTLEVLLLAQRSR